MRQVRRIGVYRRKLTYMSNFCPVLKTDYHTTFKYSFTSNTLLPNRRRIRRTNNKDKGEINWWIRLHYRDGFHETLRRQGSVLVSVTFMRLKYLLFSIILLAFGDKKAIAWFTRLLCSKTSYLPWIRLMPPFSEPHTGKMYDVTSWPAGMCWVLLPSIFVHFSDNVSPTFLRGHQKRSPLVGESCCPREFPSWCACLLLSLLLSTAESHWLTYR